MRRKAAYVLVKLYSDCRVEVFGEGNVIVKVVELPGETTVEEELLLEEWLEVTLPEPFRKVNWPGYLRGSGRAKPFRSFWSFVKGWWRAA